jgi:CelD/BcsL family acetyltransferase involved in cellulose biosynthesis
MKISIVAPSELSAHRPVWRRLQSATLDLASPYFCPEFIEAAGAVRPGLRVAVLEEESRAVGFFPFERNWLGEGRPAGGRLSDYHGVIATPETHWSVAELLRACGLVSWRFDHLPVSQKPFAAYSRLEAISPALDLSQGFEAYRGQRRQDGSLWLLQLERKARKMARELGPLRFEAHAQEPALLERVLAWKSAQCQRTGTVDFFALRWTRELVERIAAERGASFGGVLSALYAGDELVAAHLGMRSERVWHWWFPVYDRAFARYSPGGILLLRVAEAAAKSGASLLDLGRGEDAYKESFATSGAVLLEGCATAGGVIPGVRRLGERCERALRESRWIRPVRPLLHSLRERVRQKSYA